MLADRSGRGGFIQNLGGRGVYSICNTREARFLTRWDQHGAGSSGLHFAACGCGPEEPPVVGCTPFEVTDGSRCIAGFYNCDYKSGLANGSTMSIAQGQSRGKGPEVRGHRAVVLVVGMAGIASAADGFAMLLGCALPCLAWIMLIGSRLLPV